jgi:hypothetical protein
MREKALGRTCRSDGRRPQSLIDPEVRAEGQSGADRRPRELWLKTEYTHPCIEWINVLTTNSLFPRRI